MKIRLMFVLVGILVSQSAIAEPVSLVYFACNESKLYNTESLEHDKDGSIMKSGTMCISTEKNGEEVLVTYGSINFIGEAGTKTQVTYSLNNNIVYMVSKFNDVYGFMKIDNQPIVMIVPKKGKIETWKNNYDNSSCSSQIIASKVVNKQKYTDVLKVVKEYNAFGEKVKEIFFYAKSVGLVKNDVYINGELNRLLSSELVSVM